MSFAFAPKIVTDGLIYYLDANNTRSYANGSSDWKDLVDVQTTGSLQNNPTFNTNGYLEFNGTNQYVNHTSLDLLPGLSKVTISCWAYNNSAVNGVFQSVIGQWDGTSGWLIHTSGTVNRKTIILVGDGSALGGINDTPTGAWNNIVLMYDGTLTGNENRLKLYYNGVYRSFIGGVGGTVPAVFPSPAANVRIGSLSSALPRYWDGDISSISIYNRDLTASEIQQNYNTFKRRYGLT